MIKNFSRILVIFVIAFSLGISIIYASDINLTLPDVNQTQGDTQDTQTEANQVDGNISNTDESSYINETLAESLTPSQVPSSSDSGLSITNIINILLITVGVIIILLAIAIIIRLKK